MKMRLRNFVGILVLIALIGTASAQLLWYYSQPSTTTVSEGWTVTMNPLPSTTPYNSQLDITGIVKYTGTPQNGIIVHVFKNDVDIGTATTDVSGTYHYPYTVTEGVGVGLTFKTGVNQ